MSKKKDSAIKKEAPAARKSNKIFYGAVAVIVLVSIIIIIFSVQPAPNNNSNTNGQTVNTSGTNEFKKQGELSFNTSDGNYISTIDIEFAESDYKRMMGLMYREKMDEKQGMLFVFPQEEPQSFWMKNTPLPLDIMFVNSNFEIVKIHKNTTPFSEQSLPSDAPAVYVVEVNGGYADRHNIKEGDKITWRRI